MYTPEPVPASHIWLVGRERLFGMINELPTCYEIVSGKSGAPGMKGTKKRGAAGPATSPPQAKQYKQVHSNSI